MIFPVVIFASDKMDTMYRDHFSVSLEIVLTNLDGKRASLGIDRGKEPIKPNSRMFVVPHNPFIHLICSADSVCLEQSAILGFKLA